MFWTSLVEMLRALILSVAQLCNGSVGTAVLLVSLVLRLALLPLTLRLARRALRHQRRLLVLKPELERLRKRYAKDAAAHMKATVALYERRGIKVFDPASLIGVFVQLPILGALFSALRNGFGAGVRFLGISNLALPNALLSVIVTGLTVVQVAMTPAAEAGRGPGMIPLVVTASVMLWLLLSASSAFSLATGAGALVNLLQSALLRREDKRGRI